MGQLVEDARIKNEESLHKASEERQKAMLLRYQSSLQLHRIREERQKARFLIYRFLALTSR